MITTQLNLPFRWYDDVLKQNRYKDFCAQNCDFQLITQCDRLLPFQIETDAILPAGLVQWLIYDSEGNEVIDLSNVIDTFIEVKTINGSDYIIYKGDVSMIGYGYNLDCSTFYYSMLSDGTNYFYSELFYTQSFPEVAFAQELFQSFLPWKWYDNQQKQTRFKGECEQNCNFYLTTSTNRLLPFQFRREKSGFGISSFRLQGIDDPSCGITLEVGSIEIKTIGNYDYFIYPGATIVGLSCGIYEAVMTSGGIDYYSELINLKEFSEVTFAQELFQSFLPWRFYDNCEKANRYKGQCEQNCNFYLLSTTERLLPFQFRRVTSGFTIDSFYLRSIDDNSCGVTLEPSSIEITTVNGFDYFIYNPADIDTLSCGVYEAVIISGGITYCSEPINLKEGLAGGFLLQETGDYILQETGSKIKTEP